jgi:hypothetical protein
MNALEPVDILIYKPYGRLPQPPRRIYCGKMQWNMMKSLKVDEEQNDDAHEKATPQLNLTACLITLPTNLNIDKSRN